MKSRKKWEVSNCCSVSLVYGLWLRHAFVEVRSSSVQYYMTWSFISDVEHLLPVQPQMCLQNGSCRTQVVSLSILLFYNSLEHSELFYSCMYMCLTKKKKPQIFLWTAQMIWRWHFLLQFVDLVFKGISFLKCCYLDLISNGGFDHL